MDYSVTMKEIDAAEDLPNDVLKKEEEKTKVRKKRIPKFYCRTAYRRYRVLNFKVKRDLKLP